MPTSTAPPPPLRRRSRAPRIILLLLIAGGLAFAFRQGVVPAYLNPLPAIDLGQPGAWLVDWRLAAIKTDPELCKRAIASPAIQAQPIADSPIKNGCGWINAVRMSGGGGARIGFDKLSCETAGALAMWIAHEVQPAAQEILGQKVTGLQSFGSYSCRDIIGNPLWKGWRSQHATANAADIGGFTLGDGRHVTVKGSWNGDGAEARFLKTIHARACRYFHVALSPDYNAAHHDHFHLDRGPLWRCK